MKSSIKVAAITGVSLIAMTAAPAFADGTGQIEGGGGFYEVKNLTQSSSYGDSITAKCGDEIEYSVRLHNSGYVAVNNLNVKATLSNSSSTATATYTDGVVPSTSFTDTTSLDSSSDTINYEAGTTTLYDGNGNVVKTEGDTITSSGVSLGSLNGSTTEYLNFKAKVTCPAPVTPVYSCDLLGLTAGDNKTVKISAFNTTATNGATFVNGTVNWGDKSADQTFANLVGQSHQYSDYGTYTVTATANFSVNGAIKSATSQACEQQVTFAPNTPPVVTPPTTTTPPTTLVNTGAGDVAGIFAAATAAGAAAYRFVVSRRLSRQ